MISSNFLPIMHCRHRFSNEKFTQSELYRWKAYCLLKKIPYPTHFHLFYYCHRFQVYNKGEFNTTAQWNSSFSLPSSDIRCPQGHLHSAGTSLGVDDTLSISLPRAEASPRTVLLCMRDFPCSGVHKKLMEECLKWVLFFVHQYVS